MTHADYHPCSEGCGRDSELPGRDACYPLEMRRCPRCHYRIEAATVAWSADKRMLLHHTAGGMHCSGTGALVPA